MAGSPSKEIFIDHDYLNDNPDHIFVFGDNTARRGHGGAAILRGHTNTYGFITKKLPTHKPKDYYKPGEYRSVFKSEYLKLSKEIQDNPDRLFLISRLGGGLADKYGIYEAVIKNQIRGLSSYPNVKFLYED